MTITNISRGTRKTKNNNISRNTNKNTHKNSKTKTKNNNSLNILSYNVSWESTSGDVKKWPLCSNNTNPDSPKHYSVCVNNIANVICNGIRCLVYPAAALGVMYNTVTKAQKYFRGHTDDVLCLDTLVTADKTVVATGQMGLSTTFIWEVPSMSVVSSLRTSQKTIVALKFSGVEGRLLVTIGEDNQVAVSDWRSQRVIACVKGEPAPTFHISGCFKNDTFLSCGDKHIRLWTLSGRNLTPTKVTMTPKSPLKEKAEIQAFLSAAEVGGYFVVGTTDGKIYGIEVFTLYI